LNKFTKAFSLDVEGKHLLRYELGGTRNDYTSGLPRLAYSFLAPGSYLLAFLRFLWKLSSKYGKFDKKRNKVLPNGKYQTAKV
jgi:hypothetical protein